METPFYLELEVDDEISFKQPAPVSNIITPVDENIPVCNIKAAVSSPMQKAVPVEPVKIEKEMKAKLAVQAPSFSKYLTMDLLSSYDEALHMPKYSQAEMDIAVAEASASAASSAEQSAEFTQQISELTAKMNQFELNAQTSEAAKVSAEEQLLDLQAKLEAQAEEAALHKTQSRALSHRLQAVEAELHSTEKSKGDLYQNLIAEHELQLQALKQQHAQELLAACKLVQQTADDRFAKMVTESEARIAGLVATVSGFDQRLNDAVTEAKAKVYEKVKAQFENGNKEFQKAKAALRDEELLREAKSKEVEAVTAKMATLEKQLQSQIDDNTVATSRQVELQSILMEVLKAVSPAAASTATATLSAGVWVSTESMKLFGKTAIDATAKLSAELAESQSSRQSLQAAVAALESSLKRVEASLLTSVAKVTGLEDRATVAEALLTTVKKELAEVSRERDQQMLAVAKLVTSQATLEQTIATLRLEATEAAERCTSLRTMNEELLAMLEKMYTA